MSIWHRVKKFWDKWVLCKEDQPIHDPFFENAKAVIHGFHTFDSKREHIPFGSKELVRGVAGADRFTKDGLMIVQLSTAGGYDNRDYAVDVYENSATYGTLYRFDGCGNWVKDRDLTSSELQQVSAQEHYGIVLVLLSLKPYEKRVHLKSIGLESLQYRSLVCQLASARGEEVDLELNPDSIPTPEQAAKASRARMIATSEDRLVAIRAADLGKAVAVPGDVDEWPYDWRGIRFMAARDRTCEFITYISGESVAIKKDDVILVGPGGFSCVCSEANYEAFFQQA